MANRIPQEFIDELLSRIDIVDIIGARITLKKSGANFLALCPFHSEKTPSFSVNQNKQFYHCFGCGVSGNAIGFLMQFDHLDFIDAIKNLASIAGLTIPNDDTNHTQIDYTTLLEKIASFYQQQLFRSPRAINYTKNRGLNPEIIESFKLGYAPTGWHNLVNAFREPKNLLKTGMLIDKNGKLYDRFRDRIMFPIRDTHGKIIGFGGRSLDNTLPKYLNSPETELFHKGSELYGLFETKQKNSNLSYIIIVEGYMDVLALSQFGINNAVATLGTALSQTHILKLSRYCKRLVFCFDGDAAGMSAAWRAVEVSLPVMRDNLRIDFIFLPENEDPDSQVRKEGREAFLSRVDTAIPLSNFIFDRLAENKQLTSIDARANLASKVQTLINKMPNGIFKQLMLEQLAKLIELPVEKLEIEPPLGRSVKIEQIAQSIPTDLVQLAIMYLLHQPELAQEIADTSEFAKMNIPNIQLLAELIDTFKKQPNLTTGSLLEKWRDTNYLTLINELASKETLISANNLKHEFIGLINNITQQYYDFLIEQLLKKAAAGTITDEEKYNLQKLIMDAKIKQ
jgi:DNA primase